MLSVILKKILTHNQSKSLEKIIFQRPPKLRIRFFNMWSDLLRVPPTNTVPPTTKFPKDCTACEKKLNPFLGIQIVTGSIFWRNEKIIHNNYLFLKINYVNVWKLIRDIKSNTMYNQEKMSGFFFMHDFSLFFPQSDAYL